MRSINFNSGLKEYAVNGDEKNVIRINVSDLNIKSRFDEKHSEIAKLIDEAESLDVHAPNAPDILRRIDGALKGCLDYIFASEVSAHAFGNVNCLSPVGEGTLFASFMEAFMPVVMEDVKAETKAHGERIGKYIEPVIEAKPGDNA